MAPFISIPKFKMSVKIFHRLTLGQRQLSERGDDVLPVQNVDLPFSFLDGIKRRSRDANGRVPPSK